MHRRHLLFCWNQSSIHRHYNRLLIVCKIHLPCLCQWLLRQHHRLCYGYINLRKKVQLRSIETNLKVAIHNPFVFFNCSYIGLVKKKYAIFWSELPKPSGIHFNRNLIPSTLKTDEDIATYLYNKFGYPKQHVIFILERRQGKYQ